MQTHKTAHTFEDIGYGYHLGRFHTLLRDYGNEKATVDASVSAVREHGDWRTMAEVSYRWDDDDGDVFFRDQFWLDDELRDNEPLDEILQIAEKRNLGYVLLKGGFWDYGELTRGVDDSNIGFWRMHEDCLDAVRHFLQRTLAELRKEFRER